MKYTFSFGPSNGIFALPCAVADFYLSEASADDLRVLLYVYRRSGGSIESGELCRAASVSAAQAEKSISFWESKGLFKFSRDPGISAANPDEAADETKAGLPDAGEPEASVKVSSRKTVASPAQYSSEEVAQKLSGSDELRFLLDATSRLLGRPLSHGECSTLIYLCEDAGLPADVIMMLAEYCVSSGHANFRYIEKAGLSWADDGIVTHELAEAKIRLLETQRSYEGRVKSIMGITGRSLTQYERRLIDQWAGWDIPLEMIKLAFDTGVDRTGKLSMSYIGAIIEAWHKKGYRTAEQAKNEKSKKANGRKTSYDIDEYVDLSMKRILKG